MPVGTTLLDLMRLAEVPASLWPHTHIWLSDVDMHFDPVFVPFANWGLVKPKAGTVITVRAALAGGDGEKSPLRTILTLAVIAASFIAPPLLLGAEAAAAPLISGLAITTGQALGAAIGIIGTLVVNAIAPPPQPRLSGLDGSGGGALSRTSPTLSITGTRNTANRFGAVPRVLGRHKIFPPLAASPFTEIEGDDQYFRMLFDFGYGPLELSDFRIGTTPIDQFEDVEMEVRQGFDTDTPITLYSNVVLQDSYSLQLTQEGGPQVLQSREDADEITADISFQGLVSFDTQENGVRRATSVQVKIEFRLADTEDPWVEHETATYTAATEELVRRGVRIVTPATGRYELRFTRLTADNTSTSVRNDSVLTALRTITYQDPINETGHALVALRIKATGQLNGVVDEFSAIAEALVRIWGGSQFTAPQKTRHPAWAQVAVLTGPGNKRPIADDRIDLDGMKAWADAEPDRTFDAVIDYPTTVAELSRDIMAAGRARFGLRDGQYAAIRDVPQTVPIQHFTPRNSFGFRSRKTYLKAVHGLKCKFISPEKDWQQDELIVYADGYDESNATEFETMEFFGSTEADQVYKDARYHMAAAVLRPETFELSCDIDHLVCNVGDLVRASHDVPGWGGGWARIKSLTVDGGGDVTGVVLDDTVAMVAGTNYGIRFRHADNMESSASVVTAAGTTATLTFQAVIAALDAPAVGDLAMFGEANRETVDLLVKAIRHERDFRATLTLIDAAPDVHLADQGEIPPYDPQITFPADKDLQRPPKPAVASVVSDETVIVAAPGGGWQSRVLISLEPRLLDGFDVLALETQFRLTDSAAPWNSLQGRADDLSVSISPVADGERIDIRLRYIARNGVTSDWTPINGHLVIGQTAPPPDVSELFLSGETLRWNYPDPPRDFGGFLVRSLAGDTDNWAAAQPAHTGVLTVAQFDIGALARGLRSYLVKAVDRGGNESVTAARLVRDLGDPVVSNVVEETDLKAAGFPGAITNGSINAGVLEADDDGSLYLANGDDLYLPDGGELYLPVNYLEMVWETVWSPGAVQSGDRIVLESVMEGNWSLEYRPGTDAPYLPVGGDLYLPNGSELYLPSNYTEDFIPWPGTVELADETPVYQIRVKTAAGSVRGRVTAFKAIQDAPDISEFFEDTALGAGGTRLAPVKSYRAIKVVNVTLQDDGGSAETVRVFDKDAALGPLVQAFNGSDVGVAATIDAVIQGY